MGKTSTSLWLIACILGCAFSPLSAEAQLTKADKKVIKKTLKSETLYLRMDAPCISGEHDFGTYLRPLVQISPEDANTAEAPELKVGFFATSTIYRGIRINDPVNFDELDLEADEGTVEIELEGVESADGERTVIEMVQIYSLDDFHKAFDLAFARRPLQEEHDDWPSEIKAAIADRKLIDGMSKRQAYYVTGTPESIETSEENGLQIEIWNLRTDKGLQMGWGLMRKKRVRGLPASISFTDGKLVGRKKPSVDELDLDG